VGDALPIPRVAASAIFAATAPGRGDVSTVHPRGRPLSPPPFALNPSRCASSSFTLAGGLLLFSEHRRWHRRRRSFSHRHLDRQGSRLGGRRGRRKSLPTPMGRRVAHYCLDGCAGAHLAWCLRRPFCSTHAVSRRIGIGPCRKRASLLLVTSSCLASPRWRANAAWRIFVTAANAAGGRLVVRKPCGLDATSQEARQIGDWQGWRGRLHAVDRCRRLGRLVADSRALQNPSAARSASPPGMGCNGRFLPKMRQAPRRHDGGCSACSSVSACRCCGLS